VPDRSERRLETWQGGGLQLGAEAEKKMLFGGYFWGTRDTPGEFFFPRKDKDSASKGAALAKEEKGPGRHADEVNGNLCARPRR